jgi:beta-glucosidase/6-phospho-beta-glucosidase/beta-galactosidase
LRLLCYDTGTKVSGFALDSTGKEKIMQKFEKGFFVGAATAAHQVEGNNIHSDYWAQEQLPHTSFAEPSGIACDHYNRYEEDIRLLADAGLNAYRFSIEWARVEPEEGTFNPEAIEHYRKVIAGSRTATRTTTTRRTAVGCAQPAG